MKLETFKAGYYESINAEKVYVKTTQTEDIEIIKVIVLQNLPICKLDADICSFF